MGNTRFNPVQSYSIGILGTACDSLATILAAFAKGFDLAAFCDLIQYGGHFFCFFILMEKNTPLLRLSYLRGLRSYELEFSFLMPPVKNIKVSTDYH